VQALGISLFGLIAYLVNFVILVVLLRVLLYKPVKQLLENRKQRIAEGLDAAERAAADAAEQRSTFERELDEARGTAQAEAGKLAQQAEQVRHEVLHAAEQEAAEIKARAREEIEQERRQAAAELEQQAAELAMAISRKVVGAALDQAAQRRLVEQFVSDLGAAERR
jgi:F-type H+-transporting ATPase subunit b